MYAAITVTLGSLILVLIRGVRTGAIYPMTLACIWSAGIAFATLKNLQRLEAIEKDSPGPTAVMRQLAHMTVRRSPRPEAVAIGADAAYSHAQASLPTSRSAPSSRLAASLGGRRAKDLTKRTECSSC